MRLAPLLALLLLPACSGPGELDLSAEGELMLTAISAEEEDVRAGFDDFSGAPRSAEADVDQPRMDRDCSADHFAAILERYDANANQAVDTDEEQDVWNARGDRDQRVWKHRALRWKLVRMVYDVDADGVLSEVEREDLFADFTTRCEVRQEQLLAEYDADGDGALSESELEVVRAEMQANREARREGCNRGEGLGDDSEEGSSREDRGMRGERRDPASRIVAAFDLDADGELNESELEAFRTTMRERIVTGAPIRPFDAAPSDA